QLVSFVRLTVDARKAAARIRFAGARLVGPRRVDVPRGQTATVYVAWLLSRGAAPVLDGDTYAAARQSVVDYWTGRLAEGAAIEVPERRVKDALRALLVQDLSLSWRYSSGNPYEEFSWPEGIDVARVLGELGYGSVERSILRTSLTRRPEPAARASSLAARLEHALRRAVRASETRLPDGSLFLPAQLLDRERVYGSTTEDRLGSYWNLVAPYALASGLFPPGSREARGS